MRVCVFTKVHPSGHPAIHGRHHLPLVHYAWKWLLNRGNWAVSQISDIKRQKARLEAMKKEAEEERQRAREAARERVLREFEKGQLGLAATSAISTTAGSDSSERTSRTSIVLFHLHVVLHLIRMNDAQLVVRSGSSTLTRQRWRGSPGRRRRLLSGKSSASRRRR